MTGALLHKDMRTDACRHAVRGAMGILFALSCPVVCAQFPGNSLSPPGEPVILQPIYRVQSGEGDFLTTTKASGRAPVVAQTAYLAAREIPGTRPLYRYRDPERNICRDAHSLEAPWKQEEFLGSTWEAGDDRILLKQYGNADGRFVTLNAGEKVPDGYQFVCDLGYCYERFGMDLTRLMSLKRGDVEVRFDRVSGGCIWHILHKGVQLVNNSFYGRQVCTALDLWTDPDAVEADRYCACDCGLTAGFKQWFTDPSFRMGSPCPVFFMQGDDAVLIRTIPVESNSETNKGLGGGPLNPVVYEGLALEKQASIGTLGRDGIIKFKLNCTSRSGWSNVAKSRVNILGTHLCQFMDRLCLYDPATDIETEDGKWQSSPDNQMFCRFYSGEDPVPKGGMGDFTCVVLHDGGSHAVGLMGASPGQGSVESFLGYHWKQLDDGKDDTEFGKNTIMMTPMNSLPIGKDGGSYVVYLLVGTLDEVKANARELYANRAQLEW